MQEKIQLTRGIRNGILVYNSQIWTWNPVVVRKFFLQAAAVYFSGRIAVTFRSNPGHSTSDKGCKLAHWKDWPEYNRWRYQSCRYFCSLHELKLKSPNQNILFWLFWLTHKSSGESRNCYPACSWPGEFHCRGLSDRIAVNNKREETGSHISRSWYSCGSSIRV